MITTTPPAIYTPYYTPADASLCELYALPRNAGPCTPALFQAQTACYNADAAHRLVYISFPSHKRLTREQALTRCIEAELAEPEEAKP